MSAVRRPILVVEDSPDDVLLLQRAFLKAGLQHSLHVVGDGDEAVAYLAGTGGYADRGHHPLPVLVLLDLKLPKRTGFEVLGWLRSQASLRLVPVVVFTTSRESVDVRRAYELGANSYLVKPVRFEELLDTVRAMDLYWMRLNESPSA